MNRLHAAAATLVGVLAMATASSASAQIFSTGVGNNISFRTAFSGPAEELSIANTLTLTSFGFWAGLPSGGTVDFMIFNTSGTLLFSTQKTFAATADGTLITADPFNFTLNAGTTYSFGLITNNDVDVSYFFPGISQCSSGVCVANPNVNDNIAGTSFADAALTPNSGGATIAVQLNGTLGATTPEPATLAMMATGLVGLAGAGVRKRRTR